MQIGPNGKSHQLEPTEQEEFVAQVFKVVNDKFVGHLSFIRVIAGKLQHNHNVVNLRSGQTLRIGHLLEVQGKTTTQIHEVGPGDIVAIAKVEDLHIGDTIAYTNHAPQAAAADVPNADVRPGRRAEEPRRRAEDLRRACTRSRRKTRPSRSPTTRRRTNWSSPASASLHLDVIRDRLKARFDLEVITKEPKIPYRETINGEGAGDHKHKKQTGGRGQFGEVHLRIYPLSREIKTQERLRGRVRQQEQVREAAVVPLRPGVQLRVHRSHRRRHDPEPVHPGRREGLQGDAGARRARRLPHAGVAVEVYFGKYHDVDSSEAAFKTAARHAFKKAFLAARPVLLEPIVKLEVTVPTKYTGAILGDLPTKRAHVENQDSLPGDLTVIYARAPLAEVTRYAAQLGSITQGKARTRWNSATTTWCRPTCSSRSSASRNSRTTRTSDDEGCPDLVARAHGLIVRGLFNSPTSLLAHASCIDKARVNA